MSQVIGADFVRWIEVAFAVAGTVLAAYVVSWVTAKILEKARYPDEIKRRFSRLVRYIIYLLGAVLIIFYLAFDIIGTLVGLGIFGIAIGIGLGAVLSSVVTGIVVVLDKTFSVGDEIKVAFFEGKVVKIGVRKVVLETKDGETVFVPTAFFLSYPVSRKSGNKENKDGE
jgi:small-conductance mechanosensitive channel